MALIESNGVELAYTEAGEGEPLLLIMGFSGQLTDWPGGFVDQLVAAGFRVIRFDNRDIGLSAATPTPPPSMTASARVAVVRRGGSAAYTVADMADDAEGLLAALGLSSAHVLGMSMGGMIAQELAIRHPQRVRSLTSVMSNTGDLRNGRPAPRLMVRLLQIMRTVPTREEAPEVLAEAFGLFAGSDWDREASLDRFRRSVARSYRPEGAAHQAAAIAASPDRSERLGAVTAPTLVVHGLEDTLILPSGGMATARAISGSRLLMFPRMGHDLPVTRWEELVEAVRINAGRVVDATDGAVAATAAPASVAISASADGDAVASGR